MDGYLYIGNGFPITMVTVITLYIRSTRASAYYDFSAQVTGENIMCIVVLN